MKVVKKQNNSKMCIMCGMNNDFGVKAPFYELEDGRLATIFKFKKEHQSYPGRVHGGMISCMLDELAGRAIWIKEPETVAVTTNLSIKYRKPVPYDTTLKAVGEITQNTAHGFKAIGKIYLLDGTLLAESEATYFKMPADKITDADFGEEMDIYIKDDVTDIDI